MKINEAKIISVTESVCPVCLARIPAARAERDGNVYLEKSCPEHGDFSCVLWRGRPYYQSWSRPKIPSRPPVCLTAVRGHTSCGGMSPADAGEHISSGGMSPFDDYRGCPYDCGLCPDHRQHSCTVLLEVTGRCNLGCPICFAAAGDAPADPDNEQIEFWYRRILFAGGPYNIQLSGGEPTMRDDLPGIVALGIRLGFNFIQLNTNGLRLAADNGYLKELKAAGLKSVFLQFDGTREDIYLKLRGREILAEKIAAIEHCAAHNIGVVLVPTLVPGVNTGNIGEIIRFALEYAPAVRGVHFQPVSYFGRYTGIPSDQDRITIPEVIREMESQTGGLVDSGSFRPPGCENALCSFHGNFILMPGGKLRPWSGDSPGKCCPLPEKAEEGADKARSFVSRFWSSPGGEGVSPPKGDCGCKDAFDDFLERFRTHTFTVSGMAFQDAWNLDLERLKDCCIHVMSGDGRLIPFCAYNLTSAGGMPLYRR